MRTLTAMSMAMAMGAGLALVGCTGGSTDVVGTVADFQSYALVGSLDRGAGSLSLLPTSDACLVWPADGAVTADGVTFRVAASGGGVSSARSYDYLPNPLERVTTCTEVAFAATAWAPAGESSTLRFQDVTKTLDLKLANMGTPRVATPAAPRFQDGVMVHCQVAESDASVVAQFVADDPSVISSFQSASKRVSGGEADVYLPARTDTYLPAPVPGRVFCVATVTPDVCPFSSCELTVVGRGAPLTLDPQPEPDAGPETGSGTDGGIDGGL